MIKGKDLILVLLVCFSRICFSAEPPLEKLELRLEMQRKNQEKVLSALMQVNRSVKRLVLEQGQIQQEIDSINASMTSLETEIEETQKSLSQQRVVLSKRIRAMNEIAKGGWTQFFFSQQKAPDFERNLKILKLVSERDQEIIKGYFFDRRALQVKVDKLRARKELAKRKQESLQKKEAAALAEISKKNQILAKIKKSRSFSIKKIQELKKQHTEYDFEDTGILDGLLGPTFSERKGDLRPPLKQFALAKPFGVQKTTHYVIKNKGVFLETFMGSQVQAVAYGKVILSDNIPGRGHTVILDHGDHYYTVYSNLDEALVQIGQTLAEGDVLGETGYSYLSDSAGLYFEVRHFSEAYDPGQWVKGLKL